MSETAHTPGPWTYETLEDERHIRDAQGQTLVWDSGHWDASVPWNDADWRLIAAAPDLAHALSVEQIDELERLCGLWRNWPLVEGVRALRAAVAKAGVA